jgi:hypothetical protein
LRAGGSENRRGRKTDRLLFPSSSLSVCARRREEAESERSVAKREREGACVCGERGEVPGPAARAREEESELANGREHGRERELKERRVSRRAWARARAWGQGGVETGEGRSLRGRSWKEQGERRESR